MNAPAYGMPTKDLFAASGIWPLAAGLIWAAIAWPLGGVTNGILGPLSAGVVAATSMGCCWLIRPWKKRTTLQWMNLWILNETGRITTSLGVLILLYFAISPPPMAFLFSYLLCALATLYATTRIWTNGMREGNETVRTHHEPGNA